MNLYIDDYETVANVQERFATCFPLLKIEFYSAPHQCKERSCFEQLLSPQKQIGEIRDKRNAGYLEISSGFTAASVERDFRKKFGLNVQVFRKENDSWIQTSATDQFTLKEQSDMAFHASCSIFPKYKEQCNDYDEL